ncbi:uncharacterized protein LOC114844469 isoform X1 [Betta splendens]|uniref:Uncharacterized protein LOC114844469 isoform X1 n=1 Tax=Betta splendens TaxID=158456 RepID=A0A8M1H6V9_BETSP|nr:uncharacterized protein LOC114844469 isoform X1 [Betta splendens]
MIRGKAPTTLISLILLKICANKFRPRQLLHLKPPAGLVCQRALHSIALRYSVARANNSNCSIGTRRLNKHSTPSQPERPLDSSTLRSISRHGPITVSTYQTTLFWRCHRTPERYLLPASASSMRRHPPRSRRSSHKNNNNNNNNKNRGALKRSV